MENLNQQLKLLIQEREVLLEKHLNKHFNNEFEAKKYIQNNQIELKRLNELYKEIKELEWHLMSSQEKKEYLENQQKLKEKYSDD